MSSHTLLEPAAPGEVDDHERNCEELKSEAQEDEFRPAADVAYEPAEVLAEEARNEAEREKDGCHHGQLLDDRVEPTLRGREVGVHRAGEKLAVTLDPFAQPDEVIVHVPKVVLPFRREMREIRRAAHPTLSEVALLRHDRSHAAQPAAQLEDALQLLIARVGEDRVLKRVAGRRLVTADGDEEVVGEKAVQLDEAVLVQRRRDAVEDEEVEVLIGLDLRPLAEVLGILDREGVEAEHITEELEIGFRGCVKIE